MKLIFLGTSAGRPTLARNVTSMALYLQEPSCRFWLFDAGEGTQHQLLRRKLKLNKLERIFITHLHGDHLYGLPGILTSRSYCEGSGKLSVYGPPGLRDYIDCVLRQSRSHLDYELEIVEIEAGPLHLEDSRLTVEAAELEHRIPCFGYRITESPRPGALNLAKLAELGVPPGPLYGMLKNGEDVALADGRTVRSRDVVGAPTPGRIVAILGDTTPCDNALALAGDADLLVHEATFAGGLEEKAFAYGHSTVSQAAEIAAKARAKRLVVTHISARYDDEAVERFLEDVRSSYAPIEAAYDFMELEVIRSR